MAPDLIITVPVIAVPGCTAQDQYPMSIIVR